MATMICPLYISEISPEKQRGRMVTLFQLTITIGIVMCVFTNWGIFSFAERHQDSQALPRFLTWFAVDENWRAMFATEGIPGLLFLCCAFFLPESPRWLSKQGRSQASLAVLTHINGPQRAGEILTEIEETVKSEGQIRFRDLFTAKLRKPLMLALLLCFFSEACGVSVVFYYGPQLLEQAGFGLGGSLGGFGTIAIVNFIATLFALKFVDSAGRRKLLAVGTIGSLLSHVAIGSLYLLGHQGIFIVLAINSFVAFFACALGPIKFVVISEIFPNRIRGQAVAVATLCIWMTSAGVAQLFPVMEAVMPTGLIFYCFALELVGLLWVNRFVMPETKGRTIEEIERSWL